MKEDRSQSKNLPPTRAEVQRFYERLPEIYAANDRWLRISHHWIHDFVKRICGVKGEGPYTYLNLGSGGLSYGLPEPLLLHVDLHPIRFAPGQKFLLADIQRLPPFPEKFSHCLCVGSVLNHCDAAAVISNASDALRRNGTFILEFETSASFELLLSGQFNKAAAIVNTFYQDRTIKLWAYSENYILALLAASGFSVQDRSSCHHLSPLVYLASRNSNFAARFHIFDAIARKIPVLRKCASHVIYACQKS